MTIQDVLRAWFRGTDYTPEQAASTLMRWLGLRAQVSCAMSREDLIHEWEREEELARDMAAGLEDAPENVTAFRPREN